MRGLVFLGDREVALREFPDPTPGPEDVIVGIQSSGLCGSDFRPYRAPKADGDTASLPIGGHEPCGIVIERGVHVADAEARIGDRVMVHHYHGCGECHHCREGYAQMCLHGSVVYGFSGHGGNAPYMRVPASTLVRLPDALSFDEGAAIACGTGTAYMALKRLAVSGRDTLAIFGQGPVGLSATLLARAMGARVVAVDLSAERLALARRHGAEITINPLEVDPVAAIQELTHGEGADATLDCTGNPAARVNTVQAARIWGRACFVGEGNTTTFDISRDIIHKQLTIYGSWTFSTHGLAECAQFIADRQVPLQRIITHRFTLDQAGEAFRIFEGGATGKCVFAVAGERSAV
jgi:threonine dehydrogenase-like Zn-dependent dehydrogenase